MKERTITRLPETLPQDENKSQQRVAVYARVSIDDEVTEMSLQSQMAGFAKLITEDPDKILVNTYVDEGITGTSAGKRKQFLQMMQDAEERMFDTIMTKSISRFARNTVTCLESVRTLKRLGINVIFLKENIDTADNMSEILLTVLAAFAQNESYAISENVKWSIRKRYERGDVRWSALYGYRHDNGNVVVHEEEADVVRWMYEAYRSGMSVAAVASALNEKGHSSPRGGKWGKSTVLGILKNERYVGDIILQKYVTIDHISHRSIRNRPDLYPANMRQVPGYYVRNNHTPIIDRKLYMQVQHMLARKAPEHARGRHPAHEYKADYVERKR